MTGPEKLGALTCVDARNLRSEVFEVAADLAALRELQAWTERRVAEAREPTPSEVEHAAPSFGRELRA